MFTSEERERLRDGLVSAAKADPRIIGAALAGSNAHGREDRWSDIDLALSLDADADHTEVVADWTDRMYGGHGAVTHLDVWSKGTLFRVFLLAGTVQVDIAFWASADFGATGPNFRLLFGTANELPMTEPPARADLIGWSWLYALHARSSIARGRVWQAEYMVSGMRDQVLALACLRYDVPATQGRGMDDLPAEATAQITAAIVRSLDVDELSRAFTAACQALLLEIGQVDAYLASHIAGTVRELAGTALASASAQRSARCQTTLDSTGDQIDRPAAGRGESHSGTPQTPR